MDFLHRPQCFKASGFRQERSKKTLFLSLTLLLASCSSTPKAVEPAAHHALQAPWVDPAPAFTDSEISMGGLSGLYFQEKNASGELIFWSHTDRGPNAEGFQDEKTKREMRPFLIPDFQPRWIKLAYHPEKKELRFLQEVPLQFPDGKPMTGLPNQEPGPRRVGDEIPVNPHGEVIAMDLMGIDPEGLCFDAKGFGWMGEEYRPSILKFSKEGKLIRRYAPIGSFTPSEIQRIDRENGLDLVLQVLPLELKARKKNRGFEGITCLNGKIYAAMQSPLPHEENMVQIVEFDPESEETLSVLKYPLDSLEADKIGDLSNDGKMIYIVEQDSKTGPSSFHKVYRFDPAQKTTPLQKTLVVDLVKQGYSEFEKVEGLAWIDASTLAVVNDNDFGLSGKIDFKTGKADLDSKKKTVLSLIPTSTQSSQ